MMFLLALYKNFIHDGWDGDMWSDDSGYKALFVILGLLMDIGCIGAIIGMCMIL